MKKIFISVSIICVLCLAGCAEQRKVARETHTMTTIFEAQMKKGKTTREQEQKFITEMKNVTTALDASIRGTKAANKTTQEAEAMAQGIDVTAPAKLDK